MAAITMTRELAFAAGTDAANRQMRKAGRTRWNLDDRNLAGETTVRICILAGLLHVQAYEGLGYGKFPYVQGNDGSWIKLRKAA